MGRFAKYIVWTGVIGALIAAAGYLLVLPQLGRSSKPTPVAGLSGDPERGAYLAIAAGCVTCHTDNRNKGKPFAGGPALKTPFGTFYGPNITPDATHGIGGWTPEHFSAALTAGLAPDGNHYFPSFPYASYAEMKSQDIVDIKSYLDTVPPVDRPSRPHDVPWPFSDRSAIGAWKMLYFRPESNQETSRGAYLVNVLGHCGECHTQRDLLAGKTGKPLAGNTNGPGGATIPGLRNLSEQSPPWTADSLQLSLQVGMKPDGDFLGGAMTEVVEHSTSKLTVEDRAAMAAYLLSLK